MHELQAPVLEVCESPRFCDGRALSVGAARGRLQCVVPAPAPALARECEGGEFLRVDRSHFGVGGSF